MALLTIVHRVLSTFLRVARGGGCRRRAVYVGILGVEQAGSPRTRFGALAAFMGAAQVIPQLGG